MTKCKSFLCLRTVKNGHTFCKKHKCSEDSCNNKSIKYKLCNRHRCTHIHPLGYAYCEHHTGCDQRVENNTFLCNQHTCKHSKCCNEVTYEHLQSPDYLGWYCRNEKCGARLPTSVTYYRYNLGCVTHTCMFDSCRNIKSNESDFCNIHTCSIAGCTNISSGRSMKCIKHKCKYVHYPCAKLAEKDKLYCIDHLCKHHECDSFTIQKLGLQTSAQFCDAHLCTEEKCTYYSPTGTLCEFHNLIELPPK